jgi:hypothetical protein
MLYLQHPNGVGPTLRTVAQFIAGYDEGIGVSKLHVLVEYCQDCVVQVSAFSMAGTATVYAVHLYSIHLCG